jgi:hypothetical protein
MNETKLKEEKKGFFTKGKVALIVFILILLSGGIVKVNEALNKPQPLAISYQEYLETNPQKNWVVLRECQLDLLRAAHTVNLNRAFIPVFIPGKTKDKNVKLVLETEDTGITDVIKKIKQLSDKEDKKELFSYTIKNIAKIRPKMTVKGLIRTGFDGYGKEKSEVRKLMDNLDPDFNIIKHNKGPETMGEGIAFLVVGLLLTGWLVAKAIKN